MEELEVHFSYGTEMREYFARYLTEVEGKAASTARHSLIATDSCIMDL